MNKKIILITILLGLTFLLSNCKKEQEVINKLNNNQLLTQYEK